MDTATILAAPGKGCPRCGGEVFHAELMFSKDKKYHKKCFTCKSCTRPLDSMLACDAPNGDIYAGVYESLYKYSNGEWSLWMDIDVSGSMLYHEGYLYASGSN